jgi:xanthine dehydrogenase YagT iron-sulfur-binding subunit
MAELKGHHELRPPSRGLSRRGFLRGSGALAAATALAGRVEGAVPQGPPILGPGPVPVQLTVNGQTRELRLEPRVTLLDALRDHLDLTGAKKVCDRGTCGACTVLIDGHAAYSCSVLAVDVVGRKIETVESLGDDHPMVQAFVAHDALQCGFCTPGFVMACVAFAREHPDCTVEDAERGLGGNICRCGTYMGIKQAVVEAARKMKGGAHA